MALNNYFITYEALKDNHPESESSELSFPEIDYGFMDPIKLNPELFAGVNSSGIPIVMKNSLPMESAMEFDYEPSADYSKWVPKQIEETPTTIENQPIIENPVSQKPLNLSGRKKQAMDYFMSKGLKAHQAAGLVGNLLRESELDPKALNKHSKAIGIAQWLGSRKRDLHNIYGKNPTFEQQLDFVWKELNSSHKKGLRMLLNSKTVEEAAANAFGYYEFSVGPEGAIRDMEKNGQNGKDAYRKGIKRAKSLLG